MSLNENQREHAKVTVPQFGCVSIARMSEDGWNHIRYSLHSLRSDDSFDMETWFVPGYGSGREMECPSTSRTLLLQHSLNGSLSSSSTSLSSSSSMNEDHPDYILRAVIGTVVLFIAWEVGWIVIQKITMLFAVPVIVFHYIRQWYRERKLKRYHCRLYDLSMPV